MAIPIASATSSPVVQSSALAVSTNSREMVKYLRVPLWPEFYPSRNTALVGVVKLRLVECGCDDLLLWI